MFMPRKPIPAVFVPPAPASEQFPRIAIELRHCVGEFSVFDRVQCDQRPLPQRPSKAPSMDDQLHQRRAVAALRERMRLHIASQVFRDGSLQNTRVAIDGEFYDVNERQLARLRRGATPAELDLERADCGEDC